MPRTAPRHLGRQQPRREGGRAIRAARLGAAAALAAAVTWGAIPVTTSDPAPGGSGVVLVPSAQAHSQLLSSQPADGSSVERVPETVTFTFNEEINPNFAQAVAVGVDGEPRTIEASASGPVVTAQLPEGMAAGRVVVRYRVVSKDGHPIEGEISFTAATGAPGAPAPTPATGSGPGAGTAEAAQAAPGSTTDTSEDAGLPIGTYTLVGLGALALIGVGLAVLARPKRDRPER